MKKRLWALLLTAVYILTAASSVFAEEAEKTNAEEPYILERLRDPENPARKTLDEYSELTFGISLPVAHLALPVGADGTLGGEGELVGWSSGHTPTNPVYTCGGIDTFIEIANDYYGGEIDYDGWCKYAKEVGAGFVVTTLNCGNGFSVAPNPVADEYLGVEPGVICTTRNYIAELAESCEKYGLKLGLYAVGDWAQRFKPISGGDSETPLPEEKIKRLEEVYGYWSELFGESVSYWWFDAGHKFIGYHGEPLKRMKAALTKGNPGAIVSFSETMKGGRWGDLWNHEEQNEFTAQEGYGIETPVPKGGWIDGVRFHRYLPLVDYDYGGSAYAITEFVEYMKEVRENGGFFHIGGGDTFKNEGGFDSTQTAVYSAIKKYVIDGEPMPEYIDGNEKIQAGDATRMTRITRGSTSYSSGTGHVSRTFRPELRDTTPFGTRGLKWHFPNGSSPNWYVNSEVRGKNGNLEYWASYENVRIPEGADNIAISVKEYDEADLAAWPQIVDEQSHLEIRIDGLEGEAIADNIKNVGHIDFFRFTKGEYQEEPVEGFHIINIPIEPVSGEHDVYLVNVLREAGTVDPFADMSLADVAVPAKGDTAIYEGGIMGAFENGDEVCVPSLDFGTEGTVAITMNAAVGDEYAGQHLDIYVDAPSFEGGRKIGTYTQPKTGGWGLFKWSTVNIDKLTGVHDIYLKARGGDGIGDFKGIRFEREVSRTDYSVEAEKLHELGLYDGIDKDEFNPDLGAEVDRQTGIVMLLKAMGLKEQVLRMTDDEADSLLGGFSDKNKIEPWAKLYFAYAYRNGIVGGTTADTLNPTGELTGKALATIIMRSLGESVDYNTAAYRLAESGKLTYFDAETLSRIKLTKNEVVGVVYKMFHTDGSGEVTVEDKAETAEKTYSDVTGIIRAADFDRKSDNPEGLPNIAENGAYLANLSNGAWVCYENVDFGAGANAFEALVASELYDKYHILRVRIDDPNSEDVCLVEFGKSGRYGTVDGISFEYKTVDMPEISGVHDVYILSDTPAGAGFLKSFNFMRAN